MIRAGLIAMALVGANEAAAQATDGDTVYSACTTDNPAMAGFCSGFIIGAIEGTRFGVALPMMISGNESAAAINSISDQLLQICPPDGVTNGQYIDIAVKHLADNPEDRNDPARVHIMMAMQDAFPCE